eukprot:2627369-Prymnesium_polylepis.2
MPSEQTTKRAHSVIKISTRASNASMHHAEECDLAQICIRRTLCGPARSTNYAPSTPKRSLPIMHNTCSRA